MAGCAAAVLLFLAAGERVLGAAPPRDGLKWELRHPEMPGGWLRDVAYGRGVFVAVGVGGTILTSADGRSWTARWAGTPHDLAGVVYDGSRFLAEAGSLAPVRLLLASEDGGSWRVAGPDPPSPFSAVASGDGVSVAVTVAGAIYRSEDGSAWRHVYTAGGGLSSVVFGGGLFVAVGGTGEDETILVSRDGREWNRVAATPPVPPWARGWLTDVAYGGGRFVVLSEFGGVLTSGDGMRWTVRPLAAAGRMDKLVYGNGLFVAVGGKGPAIPPGNYQGPLIAVSKDGSSWHVLTRESRASLLSVAYGAGRYVAVGYEPTRPPAGKVLVSTDGRRWIEGDARSDFMLEVVFAGGQFLAKTSSGRILVSRDGLTWKPASPAVAKRFRSSPSAGGTRPCTQEVRRAAVRGSGILVAAAEEYVCVSRDGRRWVPRRLPGETRMVGVSFGDGLFVAVGLRGGQAAILTSRDGLSWSAADPGVPVAGLGLTGVTYGAGRFVAVGGMGTVLVAEVGRGR